MDIIEALKALDHTNDAHWTVNGAPRLEAVRELTGNAFLRASDIQEVAPGLNRSKASRLAAGQDIAEPEKVIVAPAAPRAVPIDDPQAQQRQADQKGPPTYRVTRGQPFEVSLVGIGRADAPPETAPQASPQAELPEQDVTHSGEAENLVPFNFGATCEYVETDETEEEAVARLQAKLQDLRAVKQEVETAILAISAHLDAIAERNDARSASGGNDAEEFQRYLASENRVREERAQVARLLSANGLDLEQLGSELRGDPINYGK